MNNPPRNPMMRPPRAASGGDANAPYGNSGTPGVPTRAARGVDLGDDDGRGRFTERVFVFPAFQPVAPGGTEQSSQIEVTANRGNAMRLVAFRGIIQLTSSSPNPYDAALTKLKLSINGTEDFTTSGQRVNPVSFAMLFASTAAPWWWYAAPPRLIAGDQLQCTCVNDTPVGEGANTITPEVAVRLVDERYWLALYGGG